MAYLDVVLDILGLETWCRGSSRLLPSMLMIKLHMLIQRPQSAAQTSLARPLVLHQGTGCEGTLTATAESWASDTHDAFQLG